MKAYVLQYGPGHHTACQVGGRAGKTVMKLWEAEANFFGGSCLSADLTLTLVETYLKGSIYQGTGVFPTANLVLREGLS